MLLLLINNIVVNVLEGAPSQVTQLAKRLLALAGGRRRIDRAYPMVTGTLPDQVFPSEWWFNHSTCIYGDDITCPE